MASRRYMVQLPSEHDGSGGTQSFFFMRLGHGESKIEGRFSGHSRATKDLFDLHGSSKR